MVALVNTRSLMILAAASRYSLSPLNASLYNSFEDEGAWTNVPIVTVTDGPVGTTSRRTLAGVDTVFNALGLFTIDRTRVYRTKFYARASATANGLLYFDLRQYLANGTPGPTNGGRNPYKPGGVTPGATLAWTEFSYTWSAADWQTGVTQVRPDFLLNYSGTTGYWEIQGFQMTDVTDAANAQAVADTASSNATAALAAITAISSDNVLSKGEKSQLLLDANTIDAEITDIRAKADAVSVSRTAYDAAYSAVGTYLATLSPSWSDTTTDTPIVGSTFRTKFTDYYTAKVALLNAIAAKAATTANWPTVAGRPPDDAIYNNLVDVSWWKRDASIPWGLNGTEFNRIVMTGIDVEAGGPKGPNDCVWYCAETNNNGNSGGGWDGVTITLDPTKTYRFAVPIRRRSGTAQAFWGTGPVADINTTTLNGNAYFSSSSSLTLGKWYLFVGYLFPAGSTGNTNDGAGIYDCDTGLLFSTGANWNMRAGVTSYYHRCYQFYASDGGDQIMGRPMINVVDGTEPSLREYFSAAATLNANQLWNDVSGAGKPSDNATSDINLTGTGVSVVGNKIVKTAATTAWDSEARSLDSYTGGAFASVKATFNYYALMFGLNTDPAADANYTGLDYAIFMGSDGTLRVYESNTDRGAFGTYASGDVLTVTYDGAYVRYMKNGAVFRSVAVVITLPLFFDSSFYNAGATISTVRFGPLSHIGDNTPFITSGTNMYILGSTIGRTSGSTWDAGCYSQEGFAGGASCSFVPQSGAYFMAGLNTDPTTDNNYASIDFAFYSDATTGLSAYASGTQVASGWSYVPGTDVLTITYDGQNVAWLKNGAIMKTVATTPGQKMYFDSSFVGGALSNVKIGPLSAVASDLTFANSTNMGVVNGVFSKLVTTGAWDAQVYSLDSFTGGAYASAKILGPGGAMFGLNVDPTTDASYSSLDYAFYWETDGVLRAYESNVQAQVFASWAAGDLLTISYDGVSVRYFQNGVLKRTVTAPYDTKFYFDSSFRDINCSIGNVTFGPMSSTNWLAVGGDGKPMSYATVGPADAATSMGFNPQFNDWPTGQTYPTGWASWTGSTPAKETTTIRTGPYAVKYTTAGADIGAVASSLFATRPLGIGVYIRGSYDVYVVNNAGGTGKPGYLFRLYTNSGLTTYRDTTVPAIRNDVTGWQRVPFSAQVNSGEQIYGIDIYQMGSWSGMPGGTWASGSIAVFDNLAFDVVTPTDVTQIKYDNFSVALGGLTAGSYGPYTNGTTQTIGTKTSTVTGGTAPYNYVWAIDGENYDGTHATFYSTGGTTSSSVTVKASATNMWINGSMTLTVTDATGRVCSANAVVLVKFGTYTP